MRKEFEFRADRIGAVLSLHKVPGPVTGGTVTPSWVRFQMLRTMGVRAKVNRRKWILLNTSGGWIPLNAQENNDSEPTLVLVPVMIIGDSDSNRERAQKQYRQVMIRILAGIILTLAVLLISLLVPAPEEILPDLLRLLRVVLV